VASLLPHIPAASLLPHIPAAPSASGALEPRMYRYSEAENG
jgi:hypothetical protein